MAMVEFYHYTSESSANLIIETMKINESPDGGPDAHFGKGVYGTKLTPSAGKRAIANNNWAGGWHKRERRGCVDYVFKIQIPRHKVKEVTLPNRHVYVHEGIIPLTNYQWDLYEV